MIAYLSTNLWTLWTIIAVLCLIIELGSGDFFVTCFAIGALCALVATLAGLPLWVQVLVFALCSVASIIFIRPSLLKRIHNRAELLATPMLLSVAKVWSLKPSPLMAPAM